MNFAHLPITASQLLRLKPREGRCELVEGHLIEKPFASWNCGRIGALLALALTERVREKDLGVVTSAGTGFQIASQPDTVLAPSLAFVVKHRLPADISTLVGFFPGAPDLAVEVVSPGDTYAEVEDETARYLEAGTQLVWILRPKQRRVEVHRADSTSALLSSGDALDGEVVVPGFKLAIARIFGG